MGWFKVVAVDQPRPRQGGTTTFGCPPVFINPTPGADHIEGYFTGGETEEEWFDDAQLAEVSARFALRPEDKVRFHLTLYNFNS